MFDTLKTHGSGFTPTFWKTVLAQVLFPIFAVLRAKNPGEEDTSVFRFKSAEDMSVWLSTTLISALRNLIDLYTFYFGVLQEGLEGLLEILVACICQGESCGRDPSYMMRRGAKLTVENDTLARIGTSCFQQLLESNVKKLSSEKWELIVSAFVALFRTTTAGQLFDPVLHAEVEPTGEVDDVDGKWPSSLDRAHPSRPLSEIRRSGPA